MTAKAKKALADHCKACGITQGKGADGADVLLFDANKAAYEDLYRARELARAAGAETDLAFRSKQDDDVIKAELAAKEAEAKG